MRIISIITIISFCLLMFTPLAQAEDKDIQQQMQALQQQIQAMQNEHQKQLEVLQQQLNTIKDQMLAQEKSVKEKEVKIAQLEDKTKSWVDRGFKSGAFKLRDAMGLEDESKLNIAGELNFRYRYNTNAENQNTTYTHGFQFYEIELFLDAAVNDRTSIFVEYPISHSNYLNPGNAWIDFHHPGELAASEYTGLMLGNFSPRFGYLNYDDNQSWIYGGRTTTNTTLVRGKSFDSQTIRNRQIGISAPIKLGSFLIEPGIFNGSGPIEFSGGSDNDRRMDFTTRFQYTLPNDLGLVGVGYWNAPKTKGATANTAGTRWAGAGATHVRDIERFAAYFKYPNVGQATLPDLSLGGKPFLIYGEAIYGIHHANSMPALDASNYTQDFLGWYLETNVNIKRDKLVGILRYDYLDFDRDIGKNTLMALTPALKWNIANNVWLNGSYEYYFGDTAATGKDDDRIALELNVWF